MIRLTVLYNLPDDADEEEFLRWRLGEHQRANASTEGVVRTDFARVDATWPAGGSVPYRFMTIAEWEDRATFERVFFGLQAEAARLSQLEKLKDPLFLVSEVLAADGRVAG